MLDIFSNVHTPGTYLVDILPVRELSDVSCLIWLMIMWCDSCPSGSLANVSKKKPKLLPKKSSGGSLSVDDKDGQGTHMGIMVGDTQGKAKVQGLAACIITGAYSQFLHMSGTMEQNVEFESDQYTYTSPVEVLTALDCES